MIKINPINFNLINDSTKVIAFYEKSWMDQKTDYAQWSHLCRSFGVAFQLVRSWDEIEVPDGYKTVCLEEAVSNDIRTFDHPEKCVYILGRTGMNNIHRDYPFDYAVSIPQKDNVCLFGISAASIILYDRVMKWR